MPRPVTAVPFPGPRIPLLLLVPILLTACDGGGPTESAEPQALVFTVQPTDAVAGEGIAPAVEVTVRDGSGNTATGSTAAVRVELGSDPGGATLQGTTTVTASGGVAVFSDLGLEEAADGYTLRAIASGLEFAESQPFDVAPAKAAGLVFRSAPSEAEGREPLTPVAVEVRDEYGNTVTASTASVTLSLANDPTGGSAVLSGTLTRAAEAGVATFDDVSIALAGEGFELGATSGDLAPAVTDPFAVHLTFRQASAGGGHTCGVTVADHAYCWGLNYAGQLGDGTTDDRTTPVPVSTTERFAHISAGETHTCGMTTDDGVLCWGSNRYGQLGDGTTDDRSTAGPVSTSESFSRVSAGRFHTCAITVADEAYCWGSNFAGELGDGTTTNRTTPVAVSTTERFAQVSPGNYTCGVTTAGEGFCWGYNGGGQLGDGTTTNRSTPVAVYGDHSFDHIRTGVTNGSYHACGVTTDGVGLCWGSNTHGDLGDGSTTDRDTPTPLATSHSFTVVAAADRHSCGITVDDGQVLCWGDNTYGQLGDGTTNGRLTPAAVSGLRSFDTLSGKGVHTCGVTTDGGLYCWGWNKFGQLGDGTTDDALVPVRTVQ